MATARGQITIVDLNDAKTVNLYLSANHPTTQIFNQDGQTFVPNWDGGIVNVGTDLVITPEILVSGVQNAKFSAAPTWKINGTTVSNGSSITGTSKKGTSGSVQGTVSIANGTGNNNYQLTLRGNMSDIDYMLVTVEGTYMDTTLGTTIPIKADITFNKSVNTGQLCMARIDSTGHVFHEGATGPTPSVITLNATLVRGSESDETNADSTPYSVSWQKRVTTSEDTDGTADGWLTLESGNYYFTDGTHASSDNDSKKKMYHVSGRTLTVYPDGVDSEDTFRALITDTYTGSAGYGSVFPATFTIVDMTDPFSLMITSSNGDTFKNGAIETTLTAHLQQGGIDVSDGVYNVTYTWQKFLSNGNEETPWVKYRANGQQESANYNPNSATIIIYPKDVTMKATFMCTAQIS